MNIECGIIIEIKDNRALVETDPLSFCSSCASIDNCKAKIKGKQRKVWMNNDIQAEIGNKIQFESNPKANIVLSLVYYLMPVILLLTGALFSANFSDIYGIETDIAVFIGGIIGLVLAFLIIFIFSRLFANKACFFPRIVGKL